MCYKKTNNMEDQDLKNATVNALVHALYSIVYLLFIVPFDLWRKATFRLAEQYQNGSFKIINIGGLWPFLSFIKMVLLEFLFDAITFLAYIIIPIIAIFAWIDSGEFSVFISICISGYYMPISTSITRDFFQIAILPIRKFISWCRKPAQQLDIDLTKKN